MSVRRRVALGAAFLVAAGTFAGACATNAVAATGADFTLAANFAGASPPEGPIQVAARDIVHVDLHLTNVGDTDDTGTLTVTLHGLDVSAADVRDLDTGSGAPEPVTCTTAGATLSCPVPSLAAGGADHRITVTAPATAAPGGGFTVDASVATAGSVDPTPDDDTAHLAGSVIGTADLRANLAPRGDIVLTAGRGLPVTVTVANSGPDTATDVTAGAVLQTNDAGFTVTSSDPRLTISTNGRFTSVQWNVGTLAPGATQVVHVVVTATTAGTTGALLSSTHGPNTIDPVPCYTVACLADDAERFTVVAAPVTPPTTPVAPAGGGELAATGSADAALTAVGLAALVAGAGLTWATRRRRRTL